ncbi:MAG: L-rhamnose isomerase [Clostridia bacterium]|nr:L-rhamnose isomerase [Clostridia bacterium]
MAYSDAKAKFAALGIDTDAVIDQLSNVSVSMHCWQGDDVNGFDSKDALSGGIQATGNYPGKATTPAELMADMDKALSLIPGKHRINLHASYAVFEDGEWADRDALEPKHFAAWVKFAKERGLGIDFNPTFFSHPKAAGLTLSSADENIRNFWVKHAKCCLKIAEYFADELDTFCCLNIWIPDGLKDVPANRLAPRARLKASLDEILATPYDKEKVLVTLESKVFGIGLESYTVGSSEFYMNYAAKNNVMSLLDNGHYHPTEMVSDKISSMLLFSDKIALHITRPVHWDSDHVVLLDDETKEMAKEVVRNNALDRVIMALDYFDASINRIAAWVVGMRNWQKALLVAMLTPWAELEALQDAEDFTALMVKSEALKMMPYGDVWAAFCERNGVADDTDWYDTVKAYEADVLAKRG